MHALSANMHVVAGVGSAMDPKLTRRVGNYVFNEHPREKQPSVGIKAAASSQRQRLQGRGRIGDPDP
jgi:hypothetical protein